jgi:hypothetical protein
MKPLPIFLAMAAALLHVSCADPMEHRGTEEVGAQLQRGVTGQGEIGPINRTEGDEAAKHSVPETHP